jgi:hypothetical protein
LKYEHLDRAPIDDGGALAVETARFRDIYNRIRPLKARSPRRGTGRVLRDIPSSSWPATARSAAPVPVEVHL